MRCHRARYADTVFLCIKIADTVVKRAAVKSKIEDMKKDGITPERSDYKVDSDINSYDYNDYGG